jgi:putative transposase
MIYPLVRELAVDGIPVTVACRVLKIARQPYYRWLVAPVTDRQLVQVHWANALFDAHRDDPEFGYRLLVDEAAAGGQPMAARTAWSICAVDLCGQPVVERVWKAPARQGRPSRATGARRPGQPRLHRRSGQRRVVDRHHRAPHR